MTLHDVLRQLQMMVFQFEGIIRQFLVDDKGTVLVCFCSLPTSVGAPLTEPTSPA